MSKKSRGRRDVSTLSTPIHRSRQRPGPLRFDVSYKTNKFALSLIEDRRTFYPGLVRPVVSINVGRPARLTIKQNPKYNQPSQTKGIVTFAEPGRLPLCVRRHQRREVLFAKGVGGSHKPQRKPRRNAFTDVSCR